MRVSNILKTTDTPRTPSCHFATKLQLLVAIAAFAYCFISTQAVDCIPNSTAHLASINMF
jgi:hypothetical protein